MAKGIRNGCWGLLLGCAIGLAPFVAGCCRSGEEAKEAKKAAETKKPAPLKVVEEVIVDNRDPGCKIVSGNWDDASRTDGNGSWGEDFLYLFADRQNVGRVRFEPAVSAEAMYDVFIYWSADPNRTTDQPVIVHDADGKDTTYHVNLQQHGNQWYSLGRHEMAPSGCWIEFTNDTDEGYCNADAVRLTR